MHRPTAVAVLGATVLVVTSALGACSSKSAVEQKVDNALTGSAAAAACDAFYSVGAETAATFVVAATSGIEESERSEFRAAVRRWLQDNC